MPNNAWNVTCTIGFLPQMSHQCHLLFPSWLQLLTVKTIRGNRTAMHYGILSVTFDLGQPTDAAEISFSNWNQLMMLSLHWTLKLKR